MSMWRAIVRSCSASVSMVTCRTVSPAAPLTATRWYTKDIFGHNSVDYHDHASRFKTALQTELSSPTRYQPLAERQTRSELPPEAQKAQYRGKYLTVYRGHQLLKTPEDLIIYQQMFWHIKPRTIIELGTFTGAAAIWMGDSVSLFGLDCQVYSMDIDHSLISEQAWKMKPANVMFLHGDSNAVEQTFTPEMLARLPHPLILIEDSHVNVVNNLHYFHKFLQAGDYIVLDETSPDIPKELGMGLYLEYEVLGDLGKFEELEKFVGHHKGQYAVDSFFNDFFGYNFTTSWNAILRRMN